MLTNINKSNSPFYSPYIPDIVPYFYGSKNIPEIIDRYLAGCNDYSTPDFFKFNDLLLQYKKLLHYEQQSSSTNLVNELFELMILIFPDYDFEIFSRMKSFCKLCAKAYLFSRELNFDIHSIKDMSGCRLILYDESVKLCYDVMNSLITFFVKNKGFSLLEAEPLVNTEHFCIDDFPDVALPNQKESYILPQYKYGVKDYIKNPKEITAYQSLHAVFLNPFTSQKIEIQVRNIVMHKRAISDHRFYKTSRYGDKLDFSHWINLDDICLNGFLIHKDGEIVQDSQGFLKSFTLSNKYRFY